MSRSRRRSGATLGLAAACNAGRAPLLLADALLAARQYTGDDRARAHELLALSYQAAASVLTKLGESDLAWMAAERGRYWKSR